jgi:hypothetical protein
MERKRRFDATLLDRGGGAEGRQRRRDADSYEEYNPAEMLTRDFVAEFGHPAQQGEDDEEEALQAMADKAKRFSVPGADRTAAPPPPREFTRHAAFKRLPDAVYERLKAHPIIEYCEYGIEPGQSAAELRLHAGLERDRRRSDVECYRFVTKAIQQAEEEEAEQEARAKDPKAGADITAGAGIPDSLAAFASAQTDDALTSAIEDYCRVLIEGREWFVVLKDLE